MALDCNGGGSEAESRERPASWTRALSHTLAQHEHVADEDVTVLEGTERALDNSDVAIFNVKHGSGSKRVFGKCMDLPALQQRFHKSADKWMMTLRSFHNECVWYRCAPTRELRRMAVHTPEALVCTCERATAAGAMRLAASGADVVEDPLQQRFILGLENLDASGYYQMHNFDVAHTEAALRYIARFHAAFWGTYSPGDAGATAHLKPAHGRETARPFGTGASRASGLRELSSKLFRPGCWWRKHLRPSVRYESAPSVFAGLIEAFPEEFSSINSPAHHATIARIAAATDAIGASAQRHGPGTIVHGDFKTSNIFFRNQASADEPVSADHVVAIDFQWTGWSSTGLGDVAYLICSGLRYENMEAEAMLLGAYYDELQRHLPTGAAYSWDHCVLDYEWEILDYFKTALPQLLTGLTPAVAAENAAKYGWLTHEYDPRATRWLCERAIRAAAAVLGGSGACGV